MVGTPAEFHLTAEGTLGSNSGLSYLVSKFKARLQSCKCANRMTDDEFARKFLIQGLLNIMAGGAFFGDFNEQCPVSHSLWDMLTGLKLNDLKLSLPSTCTYSSYQSQVICLANASQNFLDGNGENCPLYVTRRRPPRF